MTDRSTDHWQGRHYDADHIHGPLSSFNPTTRIHSVLHQPKQPPGTAQSLPGGSSPTCEDTQQSQTHVDSKQKHVGVYTVWRSRDNRKGRHALHLPPPSTSSSTTTLSSSKLTKPTTTAAALLTGIARMLTRFPVWDVSYDVATIFTLGSVVWVINGFFVLIPLTHPAAAFSGEAGWGGGISACVGATIFEVGSVLLMIEAVNENRSDCFGWALERSAENLVLAREEGGCRHHHADKGGFVGGSGGEEGQEDDKVGAMAQDTSNGRKWTWWPSWYELRTHYLRDIGFLACFSQWIGATVFWISGFTGLPQILNVLTVPAANGIYWLPQVIGGTGFIVSSCLFMLETQSKWYKPALDVLGWHIGFWNLIGALGFTLCGALGFAESNEACLSALTWSTFVGSWAFLIGSIIQWYESLDKYPVTVDKSLPPRSSATQDQGEKGDTDG